jgi:hypothetical protein
MATEQASDLMTFYDNYQAPLPAGSYRFVLQQTVSVEGEESRHYYSDQAFEILAPRYIIESSEIQAYYPPSGGVADYQSILPHLVMRTRSLPWERRVWSKEEMKPWGLEPWLALLVLSEKDISEGQAVVKTGTVADLAPEQTSAAQWSRNEDGAAILLPKFDREPDAQTPVRLLDLDLKLFLKLCPRREELPMLAHIRCVDTADKIPLEMVANGEFAVLVANRFPPRGANTIHLISLEGWKGLLDAPEAPPNISRVRLITLASWSFVNDPAGDSTFGGLMQRLRKNATVFGVAPPEPAADAYVNQALTRGYVPIDYQPAESTPTFAWYRGPLSPHITKPASNRASFKRADAALIFDDSTGIMDVSYAAAWELGRLLALASPAFSKGLRLFVERCQNADEFAEQVASFLDMHRSSFTDLKPGSPPQPGRAQVAITDELVQWIARLVMLYPVPFHYLVPHPALLPNESLRFFHLDDNWVAALVEGALSLAVRRLADQRVVSWADLQSALSKIVYQHRLRLQGKTPQWNPKEPDKAPYMETPKSGFLLRSSIVTDWPGVEVTVTTSAPPSAALPEILRLDQIADGVLFCLARGSLQQLTFREPREGLTFGVTTDGMLKTLNVKKNFLRADCRDGVVNVADLRLKLGNNLGSAEFARRMIRMPEEQVIEWS